MAVKADTAHLFAQSRPNYNSNIEQPEVELHESLTTMELKKTPPSGLVGGAQTQNRLVPYLYMVDKNSGGISRVRSPNPTSGPPAQGSSVRKINPHNFWLHKPAGIQLVEETSGAPSSSS